MGPTFNYKSTQVLPVKYTLSSLYFYNDFSLCNFHYTAKCINYNILTRLSVCYCYSIFLLLLIALTYKQHFNVVGVEMKLLLHEVCHVEM